ncbi:hypothetical protein JW865_00900 [Candidatus Bathyarchaeota archaeon]|nr:hypothetical protein [Candidatus Bathyarchaeota archaeon]
MIIELSQNDYSRKIYDSRFNDNVTVWWIIVRGNLDYEIHHRGQLVAYHRILIDQEK